MALLRLLLFVGCLLPAFSLAAPLKVHPGDSFVDLNPYLHIHIDQSGQETIESILSLPDQAFEPLKKFTLGYVKKPIWLKLDLDLSEASPETWVLYDDWLSHDNITLYHVHQGQYRAIGTLGVLFDIPGFFDSRKLNFPVDNTAQGGSGTYYLKVVNDFPTIIGFRLATQRAFGASIARENLLLGGYYGALLVLFIHSIIMARRDSIYLYYSTFLAALGVYHFFLNGFRKQFFGVGWTVNELPFIDIEKPATIFNYTIIFLAISYTAFARRYLETQRYCPRWDRFIQVTFKLGIGLSLISVFFRNELAFKVIYGYHVVSIMQFLVAGFLIFGRDGGKSSHSHLPFWLMLIGLSAANWSSLGVLQSGFLSKYGYMLSSLFVVLTFSLGISRKIFQLDQQALLEKAKSESLAFKSEALSRLVERIGLDLKKPINSILSYCEEGIREKPEIAADHFRTINRMVRGMTSTVDKLIELTGLENSSSSAEQKPFQTKELFRSLNKTMFPYACQKNINLKTIVDNDVPETLVGDIDKIRRLLEVVTENAVDHTKQGHVKIKAELHSLSITNLFLRFTVADSGSGISHELQTTVFDQLNSGDANALHQLPASCFGLRIAAELLKLLGGYMTVTANTPVGTTATLFIPFKLSEAKLGEGQARAWAGFDLLSR